MKKDIDNHSERENYLENRAYTLELFESSLQEVQRNEPSLPGKICGMNYQEMAFAHIFGCLEEQEDYINSDAPWVDKEEEREIYLSMVEKAKSVFGEEKFNEHYVVETW